MDAWCNQPDVRSGGFKGGRAGSGPLLGDGLTPSLTVFLICDNGTVLWRHHRQFISSNTQNMVYSEYSK